MTKAEEGKPIHREEAHRLKFAQLERRDNARHRPQRKSCLRKQETCLISCQEGLGALQKHTSKHTPLVVSPSPPSPHPPAMRLDWLRAGALSIRPFDSESATGAGPTVREFQSSSELRISAQRWVWGHGEA